MRGKAGRNVRALNEGTIRLQGFDWLRIGVTVPESKMAATGQTTARMKRHTGAAEADEAGADMEQE